MSLLTEGKHSGECIVSEANGSRSRAAIVVASGQNLVACAVVGAILATTLAPTADAGNTGDGTMGTVTGLAGVKEGTYTVTFVEPATNLGSFMVEDPDGENVGSGVVGTVFSGGGVSFTIADGAADFVAGDQFTIAVSGSGEYGEYDPTNIDGTGTAVGVLLEAVDASTAAKNGVIIARDAEVNLSELAWFAGASAGQKTTGLAELATKGIIGR